MSRAAPANLIKIVLRTEDDEVETPFAEDLGPAEGAWGSRRVRLVNIPFLHAKPTYGDVIVVEPGDDGRLTWSGGKVLEDGGRWLMILDYEVVDGKMAVKPAFQSLAMVAEGAGIIVEGCFPPRNERPGRAYLAPPKSLDVDDVLEKLEAASLPLSLALVHPRDDEEDDDDD